MRIGLTDAKRSVAKAYDVINATRKATRGTVIESSKSVMANARRMDQSPSDWTRMVLGREVVSCESECNGGRHPRHCLTLVGCLK